MAFQRWGCLWCDVVDDDTPMEPIGDAFFVRIVRTTTMWLIASRTSVQREVAEGEIFEITGKPIMECGESMVKIGGGGYVKRGDMCTHVPEYNAGLAVFASGKGA